MINMFRQVFNSIAFDVLDKYKDGKLDKQKALTKLNKLADYVRDNDKSQNNSGDNKDNKR